MIVSKDNSESKMPQGLLPIWSVSQAAVAASMVVLMQITFYATEVLGLSPGLIGAILMGTKFLDAAAYAVLLFAGSNLPLVITFAVIGGIGLNCLAMINTMFLIHTIDYGEWHTGKRVEGMCFSFYTFSSKVGNGLASLIAGGIMMVGGYVIQAETQTPAALISIRVIYALIPALCCIGVILALICFDLEKRMPEISKDLRERQAPAQV
jgi:Na+/melibiose symporter-like transporter